MNAIMFTDGAVRQRSGHAAIGISICAPDMEEVYAHRQYIGDAKVNQAEYLALICGISLCLRLGITDLVVYTDSQIVACQINGAYRALDSNLRYLRDTAKNLAARLASFSITYISRTSNERADALAAEAMQLGLSHRPAPNYGG